MKKLFVLAIFSPPQMQKEIKRHEKWNKHMKAVIRFHDSISMRSCSYILWISVLTFQEILLHVARISFEQSGTLLV